MAHEIDPEKLIEEVEKRPAIWDMTKSEYGDRQKKKHAWEEIINIFVGDATLEEKKKTGKVVQDRWKNLRDRYAKDRKSNKKLKSGSAGKKKTPYIYATQIGFLNNILDNKSTTNSLDEQHKESEIVQRETEETDIFPDDSTQPGPSTSSNKKSFAKRRRLDPVEMKIISSIEANTAARREAETKQRVEKCEDDDFHFLLSLHPTLKNIPEDSKLAVRMEIMQILLKYAPSAAPTPRQTFHQVGNFRSEFGARAHLENPQVQPDVFQPRYQTLYNCQQTPSHFSQPPPNYQELQVNTSLNLQRTMNSTESSTSTQVPLAAPSPAESVSESIASYVSSCTAEADSELSLF
ncbi:unnamed protein product [Acanthoscelides obtectus]|uniref:MADF domain-containing protein n=1 Tax=Acanthoscelides obtectus TaxID=200917 RepID=A0A9P0JPH3_ACAOB|nr:unnamed protein product [Acanthoscelides obtectus]CAK1641338.1 hypothetical protein AOBTE_LOCUS12344 [Acanthoscelides obtectus]